MSCAVSHSKHSWGLDLVAASDRLEAFCATNLLCPPHPLGWSDLTDIAVIGLTQAIRPRIDQIDGALFGRDAAYEVTLWDSPSLRKNLELLSRLPELSTLLIYTDRKDNEVWPLIRKVHVTDFAVHDLAELGSHDASVSGIVVDRRGGPVHGGWVTISSRTGRELCSIGLNDDGKFTANGLPSVAYQLHACGVPSSSSSLDVFLGRGVEVKESEPVDAKPGDKAARRNWSTRATVPTP